MERTLRPQSCLYEIHELLGEGAHSHVYRAWRKDVTGAVRQQVALKVLKSKTLVDQWRREFESLSRVKSIHCVALLGVEWCKDQPALVLEYVEGLSLRQTLALGRFSTAEVQHIVQQIQQGLLDLKCHGLCHGDLSLNNVLIDVRGQVRLIDFGLSGGAGDEVRATAFTAAPEVLRGQQPNWQSDLFSLGVIQAVLSDSGQEPPWSQVDHALLDPDPERRRPITTSALATTDGQSLAAKIRRWRQQEQGRRQVTELLAGSLSPALSRAWSRAALLVALVILVPGSAHQLLGVVPSFLQVRASEWMEVVWDGRVQGYAPLDIKEIKPGIHQLLWRTRQGEFTSRIHLRPGATLQLNKKFFDAALR